MTQYYSRKDYNYAGDSNFTIPFSYISKDDINVYVNDEAITTFTWLNDSQINITSALTTGDIISIRRNTPIDEKIVTYQNMSMVLNDDNLNLSQDQILDAVQEIYDNNVTFEIKVNNDIDAIETVANTALTNANTAINTANNAETKANNAVSTANSADSKADNAVSTANTASNNATTAVNTANSAVNTANSASNLATQTKNRVDAFEEDIDAVIEAAEKIDELEEAVQTAVDAAQTAGDKATIASNKATEATNAANRAEAAIPTQTGQNGKFLKTNGTNTSWEEVDALPSQTGQSGKFLTTDGTDASWATVTIPTVDTDNITISKNLDDELQTVGVIDQNNTTNAIKTWTGTKAQYNAIVTKDSNTQYTCTDSGEIYLGTDLIANKAGNRNIGEIVTSTIPLTDAGLHLLDGALIDGSGSYSAFVDYIADLYNNTPVEDIYNVNTVGSLTNDNGVLSGFTYRVYATIKEVPYSTADSIEILLKTTTGTLDSTNYNCFYSPVISNFRGVNLQINPDSKIQLYVSSNAGSSWDIVNGAVGTTTLQSNTQYYFKYVYTGTNHILYMSTTGAFAGEETTEVNVTNSNKPSNSAVSLGLQAWSTNQNNYWRGSIDLNESYININGERWWSGKTEIRAGFLTEDDWQQSVTDYGVCDKYVYDSTNNTVRLPKIGNQLVHNLPSILGVKGNGNAIGTVGLASAGTTTATYLASSRSNGTFGIGSVSAFNTPMGLTKDATKSGLIAETDNINTADVYYYVVIATSTKTDIQVDIDEIATDLNGKMDVDGTNAINNLSASASEYFTGLSFPSNVYENIAASTGSSTLFTYTAPADGWVAVSNVQTAKAGYFVRLASESITQCDVTQLCDFTIPVRKGAQVIMGTSTHTTFTHFDYCRFIYAKGEV